MKSRLDEIRDEVKKLYGNSPEECKWLYEHHVLIVEKYAIEIAKKESADIDVSAISALMHDIARTWDVWDEPELMNESLRKSEELMKKHGYSEKEIDRVRSAIVPHSCKDKLPDTKEGKILATADALAHLMTDFYVRLPFYKLKMTRTPEGYKKWVMNKMNRDINKKIFFSEYRQLAKERFESLRIIFS